MRRPLEIQDTDAETKDVKGDKEMEIEDEVSEDAMEEGPAGATDEEL